VRKKKIRKNADCVNTTGMDIRMNSIHNGPVVLRKDIVLCFAPLNGCRDTQHPTWRIKIRKAFQWGSGGWEAEACIAPAELLRYLWGCVQCLVSSAWFLLRV
jgi:hypothetical protein